MSTTDATVPLATDRVARALADLEALKTGNAAPDRFLDYIGNLIKKTGDPAGVFERVWQLIERERAGAQA